MAKPVTLSFTEPERVALAELVRSQYRTEGDCWRWTGPHSPKGYGRISIRGRSIGAHRVAYTVLVGPIPEGLEVDHLCRVRDCINPEHLEPVTHRENLARVPWVLKTHCPSGHAYTPENTALRANGKGEFGRKCRACETRSRVAYNARQRGSAA